MFMERPLDEQDAEECAGIFATLTEAVARCVEAGALAPGEPAAIATEIWVLGHGIASLELAALLTPEQGASLAAASARASRPRSARPRAAAWSCVPGGDVPTPSVRRLPAVAGLAVADGERRPPTDQPPARRGHLQRAPSPSARGGCGPSAARRRRASCRAARPAARGRRWAHSPGTRTRTQSARAASAPARGPPARPRGTGSRRAGPARSRPAPPGSASPWTASAPAPHDCATATQPVVPVAAAHAVAARPAVDDVVAATAVEHVVARAAAELLVSLAPQQRVRAVATHDALERGQRVARRGPRRPRPPRGRR